MTHATPLLLPEKLPSGLTEVLKSSSVAAARILVFVAMRKQCDSLVRLLRKHQVRCVAWDFLIGKRPPTNNHLEKMAACLFFFKKGMIILFRSWPKKSNKYYKFFVNVLQRASIYILQSVWAKFLFRWWLGLLRDCLVWKKPSAYTLGRKVGTFHEGELNANCLPVELGIVWFLIDWKAKKIKKMQGFECLWLWVGSPKIFGATSEDLQTPFWHQWMLMRLDHGIFWSTEHLEFTEGPVEVSNRWSLLMDKIHQILRSSGYGKLYNLQCCISGAGFLNH